MMRRLTISVMCAVAAALCFASPSAASGQPTVQVSHGTSLPFRTLIVSLPAGQALSSDSVRVYENGNRVGGLTVVPESLADSSQFGVVLVLDASNSMAGAPEEAATAAARQFAQAVSPSSQVAVVTFNSTTDVAAPLTTDQSSIRAALASPPAVAHGTHIYDGVEAALQLLRQAHVKYGSVVLLSDGTDTGSTATEAAVTAAARKADVRIYTVGLQSGSFDPSALQQVAQDGRGSYTEASSVSKLAAIFGQLGEEVANQYVIRYRTSQPAGEMVHVAVKLPGYGLATTGYQMPVAKPGAAFHRSLWTEFWRSLGGMILTVIACSLLIGSAIAVVLRPGPSRLRSRVGAYVSVSSGKPADRQRTSALLTERLYAGAGRSIGRMGFWTRFKQDLELAEIHVPAAQIVLATLVGVVLLGWLLAAVTGFPVLALGGLLVVLVPRSIVSNRLRKRREEFSEQLPDNLQVMASAMRAGHSFVGALAVVVEDSPEPSRSEFSRVVADEQFGVPLSEAIARAVERMDNRDLAQVGLVAAMQQETGGNTAEVLDRVVETIRERFELRRLVKTLTAQGRMSRWVVSLLPVGLLLIITAINPTYMQPLYDRPLGRLMLVLAAGCVVLGSYVIKRIVDIKV